MSDPRIDRIAARWSAAQTVARVTVDDLLADLPDDTYTNVVPLFPDWVPCPTSSDSGMSAGYVGFDLGVGGAGAEVAHLGSVTYQTTSIEELRPATGGSTFIPADIPSGSRLAVRVIDSLIVNNTGYSAVLIGVP